MVFKVFWGERRKKKGGIQVTGLMSWEQERVRASVSGFSAAPLLDPPQRRGLCLPANAPCQTG